MNNKIFEPNFSKKNLLAFISKQLNNFFPDEVCVEKELKDIIDETLYKIEFSLKHVKLASHSTFSILHSDLYAQFIYFASNTAFTNKHENLANKLFYLNKALHSFNCTYSTKLPNVFLLLHTVGTILGKANYNDFLVVNQGVTVGSNNEQFPTINEKVMLRPHSSVIGKSIIGSNSSLSINTTVFNEYCSENKIIIGNSPNLNFKVNTKNLIQEIFFI